MKIGHIAIWTLNLEELRTFYLTYFKGISNEKYINEVKGFESYFIHFDEGATLELMRRKDVQFRHEGEFLSICHIAFTVGSKEDVCELTERLRADGYSVVGEPRTSGDGYFESVVLDPDGNRIELLAG